MMMLYLLIMNLSTEEWDTSVLWENVRCSELILLFWTKKKIIVDWCCCVKNAGPWPRIYTKQISKYFNDQFQLNVLLLLLLVAIVEHPIPWPSCLLNMCLDCCCHQLIERAGRSADDEKVEQKMAESWEELSLVSSSPTMIRKGIEGVVMKHVSKAAKQQKGIQIQYVQYVVVPSSSMYSACLQCLNLSCTSPCMYLTWTPCASSPASWPVPTTPNASGDEPQTRIKIQEDPVVHLHLAGGTSHLAEA